MAEPHTPGDGDSGPREQGTPEIFPSYRIRFFRMLGKESTLDGFTLSGIWGGLTHSFYSGKLQETVADVPAVSVDQMRDFVGRVVAEPSARYMQAPEDWPPPPMRTQSRPK